MVKNAVMVLLSRFLTLKKNTVSSYLIFCFDDFRLAANRLQARRVLARPATIGGSTRTSRARVAMTVGDLISFYGSDKIAHIFSPLTIFTSAGNLSILLPSEYRVAVSD